MNVLQGVLKIEKSNTVDKKTLEGQGGRSLLQQDQFRIFTNQEDALKWGRTNFKEWKDGLSEDELKSVRDYSNNGFKEINESLRNGEIENLTGGIKHKIRFLSEAISKGKVPEDIITYRGTSDECLGEYKNLDDRELVGKVVCEKGFLSTSMLKSVARFFTDGVILKIEVKKGSEGVFVSDFYTDKYEGEILFNKGQKLKITDVDYQKKIKLIKCRLVD